jgi:DNA-binding NarL/FixJ family response regulator
MKLLLVDTQALYREGLALLIARSFPELELLQAGDIAEALAQIERHGDLDLMLLDLELPDAEGARGLRQIRARAPGVTVILLSGDTPPETLLEAIQAGAAGFIPKASPAGFMQKALRRILDGRAGPVATPPAPRLAAVAVAAEHEPEAATAGHLTDLTPRQRDVLRLLIEGKTNKLICRELTLSESTVKTHLASIFRRLGATSRTQAVVAAARMGLQLGPAVSAGS